LSHVSFLFISFSLLIYFCISSLLSLQIDRYASRALHNVNFIANVKSDIYDASVEASEFQGRNHGKIKPKSFPRKRAHRNYLRIFGNISIVLFSVLCLAFQERRTIFTTAFPQKNTSGRVTRPRKCAFREFCSAVGAYTPICRHTTLIRVRSTTYK
jgi:hypothetical protein